MADANERGKAAAGDFSRGGKLKVKHVRGVVAAALCLSVVVGIVGNLGWGTLSAFGPGEISLLCPLGALEAMIGSRSVAVHALVGLAGVLVIVLLSGKAFCSWACPVGYLSRFLQGKKPRQRQREAQRASAAGALAAFKAGCNACGGCAGCGDRASEDGRVACGSSESGDASVSAFAAVAGGKRVERRGKLDGRHVVLAGALGTTFVFGFPVFCIVCPVGLTFATVVAFVRFVGFNEPSLGLVLFPAILVVELVVLRGWCHTLCPMGALMSLVANGNRTLRPRADVTKCRRGNGGDGEGVAGSCNVCASVCPELIDPRANLGARPLVECTRCGRCVDACPSGALSFLPKRGR